jgi:hypothetical protein
MSPVPPVTRIGLLAYGGLPRGVGSPPEPSLPTRLPRLVVNHLHAAPVEPERHE